MTERRQRGEFQLIRELFAPLAKGAEGALDLRDDACLIRPDPGHELVVTSDAIVADVHFLADDPPETVGRKLLRVNLSDLAAMGAAPLGYLLTAILAPEHRGDWIDSFAAGLGADQAEFDITLLGGDTVATTGPSTFAVTAFGQARRDAVLRRGGARVGDLVYVSGTIGDACLGLMALRGELPALADDGRPALVARYRVPTPRLALGRRLAHLASAAIDISDGLLADLGHLCASSGLGAEIRAAAIPMAQAVAALLAQTPALRSRVLSGGDDYELLFTVPSGNQRSVEDVSRDTGVPIRHVGEMVAADGVRCLDEDGATIPHESRGYAHF